MNHLRRFWPVLLLALVPLIPLWRAVFAGEAIGPFDQIRQMAPWNGPKPDQPWDVLQADGVLQFYPWRDMVLRSWGEGHLPFWNHYQLAGYPLLGNSQSAGFYPPHIVLGLLHVPTPAAMTVLAWFHLFWAGLGVYWLSRRSGASRLGAAVGGVSFSLSAFMLAWTALPSVITTVAWIPWLLGSIYLLFGERPWRGALTIATCTAMMVLAGHLQFVAYGFFAAVFLIVWLAIANRSVRGFGAGFAAAALGICIAAPQLLPVLQYSQFSHRRGAATTEGYAAYTAGAIKPFELANLGVATSLGNPRQAVDAGGNIVSEYWPPYAKQGANFAESAVTLGPLLIGLLALVPWRRKTLLPLALIAGLALLLAIGSLVNLPLYFLLPGWSSTGSPGRIIVLFVLAACVLAATGLSPQEVSSRRLGIAAGVAAGVSLVAAFVFPLATPAWQGGMEAVGAAIRDVASGGVPLAAITAIVIGCGGLLLLHEKARRYRSAIILVPILLAWTGYASNLVTTGKPIDVRRSESFERVAVVNSGWGLLSAAKAMLPPNTAYLMGLHELGGYDSLIHRATKDLLQSINGQDPAPPANGNMMFIKPSANPQLLGEAGVTKVLSLPGNAETSLPSQGRAFTPAGPAQIVSENPQQIKLRATGPGRLVLRDRNMPGWLPKVDGAHVPLLGSTWMEIDLPPGEHQVEFNYVPPGFMTGVYLSFAALLLTAFLIVQALRERESELKSSRVNETS